MNLTFSSFHSVTQWIPSTLSLLRTSWLGNLKLWSPWLKGETHALHFHIPLTSRTTVIYAHHSFETVLSQVLIQSSLPIQWTLSSISLLGLMSSINPSCKSFAPSVSGALHYHRSPPMCGTIPSLSPSEGLLFFNLLFKCPFNTLSLGELTCTLMVCSSTLMTSTFTSASFRFLYLTGHSTGTSPCIKPVLYLLYTLLYPTCFSPWTQSLTLSMAPPPIPI